jgi:DNA helicase HerA-like ATPase
MLTPIEHLAALVIGTVESVSPGEVRILLELDAPNATALNTGTPAPFPRINGYVLLPNEAGATVAYISWIGIERSPYPKRAGFKDFGLIDLPFPLRKMTVIPVGTLTTRRHPKTNQPNYELERGVIALPSIGDQVLMPTPTQVAAIVGSKDSDRRVRIGTSPLAADAPIMVDPDKLFGRHLAILGNTGSGKSCTVAGLIRWSMAAAEEAIRANGDATSTANARFIILDPNGEYAKAFADRGDKLRLFRVPPVTPGERPLDVPAWLWNGHEWTAMAHAQPGAQRPLLLQGLRELKSGNVEGVPRAAIIRRYLQSYSTRLSSMLAQGTQAFAGSVGKRFECARLLQAIVSDTANFVEGMDEPARTSLTLLSGLANGVVESRRSNQYFNDFSVNDLESIRTQIDQLVGSLPEHDLATALSEDAPRHFDVSRLGEHLEQIATEQGGNLAAFTSTLRLRIRGMLDDPYLGSVINRTPPTSFENWLGDYVGANGASNGEVAVVDLSLVASEVIHVVVAVLARLIFESLQHYRRANPDGLTLPTVLVLEEAHTFIKRTREDEGTVLSSLHLCREAFERIAREGRKFGLGLVLSSQRPSELSPTVLAQCNTFLLHRIVNDADQSLVARLVPDNVGALLRELPSLPSKQAILLGWATPIPVLLEVNELAKEHQPQSSDPDFWDVWTLKKGRTVDWAAIANGWSSNPQ